MSWTDPKTWAVGEVVTANLLNEQLRDNLNALKVTNSGQYTLDESTDYTTTSTSFVDVDATKLALNMTTTGGDVLMGFTGTIYVTSTVFAVYFNVDMDGTTVVADDGLTAPYRINGAMPYSFAFTHLVKGVSAGAHTFKLQWKVTNGTGTLFAGAGTTFTTSADTHPQFWVLEV